MNYVNIGVVAHVDAGKTSLTERLLFSAGVIDHIGSVDHGDTQTDSLELERKRGITIKSAVVTFPIGDMRVNVIDTPGHSDFVAEVERALCVLDGAILVISAVEGIQAGTRVLMRSLNRLRIPTLIFINKIDRTGARSSEVLDEIKRILTPHCMAMNGVDDIGTSNARATNNPKLAEELTDTLTTCNESFLDAYLQNKISPNDFQREFAKQTQSALTYPIFFGSAISGEGIDQLVNGIRTLLPSSQQNNDQVRAMVFKIERGRAGEKTAYVRMYSGTIAIRDRFVIYRHNREGGISEVNARVSAVQIFDHGAATQKAPATAGAIAKLWGLTDVQIGDQIGTSDGLSSAGVFAPPTLETIVTPTDQQQRSALFTALQTLAEQDPLINVRRAEQTGTISVSLYGEVQKEVITSTLADTFGIDVTFEESRMIYIEKPTGIGEAVEILKQDGPNFFWATIGLHVEPAPFGAGVTYQIGGLRGILPLSFHKAIEETVFETLHQGLHGWEVLDCAVTLTHAGYKDVESTAGDFRHLTRLLERAQIGCHQVSCV